MIADRKALASLYSRMSLEEFSRLKREDLTDDARFCYDQEMERRSPGWTSQRRSHTAREVRSPAEKLQSLLEMRLQIESRVRAERIGLSCGFGLFAVVGLLLCYGARTFRWGLICCVTAALLGVLGMVAPDTSRYSTGHVILWLRRFHLREHKEFLRALPDACRYLGMPITVQDSAVHFSQGFVSGRLASFLYLLLPLLGIFGILFALSGDLGSLWTITMVLGYLVAVLALLCGYFWAFVRIRNEPQKQMVALLQRVRRGKLRSAGVVVLRIHDRFWREVVEMAMRQADAIVIDVTDPSENVIWELRTALRLRSSKTILLACPQRENCPAVLPQAVTLVLQQFLGPVSLSQFPVLFYPAGKSVAKGAFPSSDWSIGLREALARCISHAPAYEVEETI